MYYSRCLVVSVLGCCALVIRADPPAKQEFKMTVREKEVFDLINRERKKKDLPALTANPLLFKVARAHSANMAKQGKLKHELDGKIHRHRLLEAGYDYERAGENIAYGDKDYATKVIVKDWMDSKNHRDNILFPEYTETGIGVIAAKNDLLYYTQVFGKPFPPKE
jgi:uncharacterized protein YkwD